MIWLSEVQVIHLYHEGQFKVNALPDKKVPFVGYHPLQDHDQGLFFGRDREISKARQLIQTHPLLLLSGHAGVGKTSFLNAGLIPVLKKAGFEVFKPVFVEQKTDRLRFDDILNIYISNVLSQWSDQKSTTQEHRTQKTLAGFLDRRKSASGSTKPPRLIIFENLETLFTCSPERRKEREDFFYQVRDAVAADPLLRVIFVIRKAWVKKLRPYADLLPENLNIRLELEALRVADALEAITRPMAKRRIEFGKGVAESLVEDLSMIKPAVKDSADDSKTVPGKYVEPVLLQIVCEHLWREIPKDAEIITQNHRRAFAHVDHALARFYENVVGKVSEENGVKAGDLRTWLEQRLITASGTRGKAYPEAATKEGISAPVLDALENLHLIRSGYHEGTRWYELSHDRLIHPLIEANHEWRMQEDEGERTHRDLENQAIEWVRQGREQSLLLKGEDLIIAERWMTRPDIARYKPSEVLRAFVRASLEAPDDANREEIRKKEVRIAAKVQKESAERVFEQAEKETRLTKRLGQRTLAILLVLLIAGMVGTLQWRSSRQAKEAAQIEYQRAQQQARVASAWEKEAEEAAKIAEANRLETEQARLTALEAEKKAKQEKQRAEAQAALAAVRRKEALAAKKKAEAAKIDAIAAQQEVVKQSREARSFLAHSLTRSAVEHVLTNPTLSLLLAMQALSIVDSEAITRIPEAEDVLYQAMYSLPLKSVLSAHESSVNAVIFGRGGKHLVSAGADGTAKIWHPVSGALLRSFTHEAAVNSIAYRANGKQLAIAGRDGRIRVWGVSSGKPLFTLAHEAGAIKSVAFSPNQQYLATAGEKGPAILWDVKSEKQSLQLRGHESGIHQIAFSPNGKYLATAGEDATVRIWDVKSGQAVVKLSGHDYIVTALAYSPDSNRIASASKDGTVRVWDARFFGQGEVKLVLSGHSDEVLDVAYSPDGRRIATASNDGTMRLWNAQSGEELAMLSGHRGSVTRLAFSPDGRYLATGGRDKTLRLYSMDIQDMMALVRTEVKRELTPEECKKYLHADSCPQRG